MIIDELLLSGLLHETVVSQTPYALGDEFTSVYT